MKIVPLTDTEAALTGYNYVAHLKGANSDLETAETINVVALSTAAVISNVVMDVVASFGGTISVGIAASSSTGTTFFSATTMTSAGTYQGAVFSAVNTTASRYLTITAATGAAACEGFLWFKYLDHSRLRNAVTN